MRKKILTEAEQDILHDFQDTKYWDVFRNYLNKENQNLLRIIAGSTFNDEFHFNKGQISRNNEIIRFMKENYLRVEKKNKTDEIG
jgi:hypothetical protein